MKTVWKAQKINIANKSRPPSTREIVLKDPADTPGMINGMKAGSSWEWYVARALWTLRWSFKYQVPINYGRLRRGGAVLDFLVMTHPYPTAISVKGPFWHRNADADKIEERMIMKRLKINKLISMGAEAASYEAALVFLKRWIGQG